MNDTLSVSAPQRYEFPYNTLRNISCPDDTAADRRVLCGHALAQSYLKLPENANVRGYLVTAEGKKRQRLFDVHRQIRDTLRNRPDEFSVLNGGITIVASSAEVDEKKKTARLCGASIINGSQTRGELLQYFAYCEEQGIAPANVYVKFEIIVSDDEDTKAEVSIARNSQNAVNRLSIAGRRGQLDELEARLQELRRGARLTKSETERASEDNHYIDSEKLLQVCTALVPPEIWPKDKEKEDPKKVFTYSMKSKCLREFQALHKRVKDEEVDASEQDYELYQYFLDIAPQALELYEKWKAHPDFKGTGLRSLERDGSRNITDVPEGILFPILSALSAFVQKTDKGWALVAPRSFNDLDLIKAAKSQYINTAKSNPWNMGKSQAVYSSLFQITSLIRRISE